MEKSIEQLRAEIDATWKEREEAKKHFDATVNKLHRLQNDLRDSHTKADTERIGVHKTDLIQAMATAIEKLPPYYHIGNTPYLSRTICGWLLQSLARVYKRRHDGLADKIISPIIVMYENETCDEFKKDLRSQERELYAMLRPLFIEQLSKVTQK